MLLLVAGGVGKRGKRASQCSVVHGGGRISLISMHFLSIFFLPAGKGKSWRPSSSNNLRWRMKVREIIMLHLLTTSTPTQDLTVLTVFLHALVPCSSTDSIKKKRVVLTQRTYDIFWNDLYSRGGVRK